MTDSHSSLGPRCPGRPAIVSCTSVPRLTATSAAPGKADFELRQYRHRDLRCDSPRRRVALLFQCSFPLGIPSSQSVKLPKNSRRSRSNLSTPLRKLRGTSASRSCRRKETLKKLHYWATDSMWSLCCFETHFSVLGCTSPCHSTARGERCYAGPEVIRRLFPPSLS